jgi:hypothetical protein
MGYSAIRFLTCPLGRTATVTVNLIVAYPWLTAGTVDRAMIRLLQYCGLKK